MTNQIPQSKCACNVQPCGCGVDDVCPTCGSGQGLYEMYRETNQEMPRSIALVDFCGWANDHPIIGHFPQISVHDPKRPAKTVRVAFTIWSTSNEVAIRIPGNGKSLLTLCLVRGESVGVDLSEEWNWKQSDFKDWISELNNFDLIDDALYASALQGIKHSSYNRIPLSRDLRLAVLEKTHGHCVYCGCRLTLRSGYGNSFHADHVLPFTKGGTDDIGNLVPACADCNSRKSAKTTLVFMSPLSAEANP